MGLGYAPGVALLRIGFGLYFLSQGIDKLSKGWLESPKTLLEVYIIPNLQRGNTEAFYRPFLENVVQPNGLLFSQLVTLGELAVGLSLVLGLLTRLGALGSAFLVLNYMLMKGLLNNAGSSDRLFLLAAVVFYATSAGLVWGLDGRLRALFAASPLTRWVAGRAPSEA
jgi:uncharacterized membrane protein YphA (DoxX/SURF4 family)